MTAVRSGGFAAKHREMCGWREEAEWGLAQSNERLSKEAGTRAKLEAGELGLDFHGLRDKLAAMGVEWVD